MYTRPLLLRTWPLPCMCLPVWRSLDTRLKLNVHLSLSAKLPKDLAQKVISSIGGELRSLTVTQLASFLQPYGILTTSDFEALTNPQSTEVDRSTTLQTCLLRQKSFNQKLPADLYLACLDSFEEDPALSSHHFFAVSILRPKSKCL